MLLMPENQDDRVIWVVVELHRPKGRVRSRIVLHLGEYRDRGEAEAAFAERLKLNRSLRECAERWALNAREVLADRKARGKFLLCGVVTGISDYADDMLRRRETDQEHARTRVRAASWSASGPAAAFRVLGLSSYATIDEIKLAYRRKAIQLHPDRGGDHSAMVQLNAAYEEAAEYAAWRG
jgi:DnaJ domain